MLKSELIRRVHQYDQISYEKDAEAAVNAILDTIADALAAGDRVELRGLGSWKTEEFAARDARNPRTGGQVRVGAHRRIRFKPSKEMRERINDANASPVEAAAE